MNRRKFVAAWPALGFALALSTESRAAEGIGCDRFHVREQAEQTHQLYPAISTNLLDPGTGEICPLLPRYKDMAPSTLENAVLDSFFGGGSKQNVLSFDSGREVSLAGMANWANRPRDYPPGVCADYTFYVGGPADGYIPKLAPVFITNQDGTNPGWTQKVVEQGVCWVWDGINEPICLNLWLLERGAGILDPDTAPEALRDQFISAGETAKRKKLGAWGACEPHDSRTPMLASFAPVAGGVYSKRVVRVGGDWGERLTFDIPVAGHYVATAEAPTANSYVEIALLQNTATGQEYPEFYWVILGPQSYSTTVWMDAGTYVIDCRAAGGWSFEVRTIPA